MSVWEIKFKGKDFLLVGDKNDGAIATKKQYENFLPSHAHLYPNGEIRRWNEKIGDVSDIKFKEVMEVRR